MCWESPWYVKSLWQPGHMDLVAFMVMGKGGITRMKGYHKAALLICSSVWSLEFQYKRGTYCYRRPHYHSCPYSLHYSFTSFCALASPWCHRHITLRQWAVPYWITPRGYQIKTWIKFHLLCIKVWIPSLKATAKLWPSLYNPTLVYAVSEMGNLVRQITHHNKQKGNVSVSQPSPNPLPVKPSRCQMLSTWSMPER